MNRVSSDKEMTKCACAGLLAMAFLLVALPGAAQPRGAQLPQSSSETIGPLELEQSAALFVGIREFPNDRSVTAVRYAVDDAVDLAYLFTLDARVRLVDAPRVILALSGAPEKEQSRMRLENLKAAGAEVRTAGQTQILAALEEQSQAAGTGGMLIVSFATHGISVDGTQYLLTATSLLKHRETSIAESKVRDIASRSDAARSLILIDACRERLRENQRGGTPDEQSIAARLTALATTHGQAVLSAAAVGQYAYDDERRGNGVFTAAILDGLRCGASTDARGFITVDALASYVETRVLTWIRKYKNETVSHATQVATEGSVKQWPLAVCPSSSLARSRCWISIASAPTSASVRIDGQRAGFTPIVRELPSDRHSRIEIAKDGFQTQTVSVDCSSQDTFVALTPLSEFSFVKEDPFDNNHNGWFISMDPAAPAWLADGVYHLGSKKSEWRFTAVAPPIDMESDFEVSVDARRERGEADAYYGFVWGLQNGDNTYLFSINSKGYLRLGELRAGQGTPITDGTVHSVIRSEGTNQLKIVRRGNQLRFLVNETVIYTMPFRPFFGPGFGLAAFDGPIVVAYDNFVVKGTAK